MNEALLCLIQMLVCDPPPDLSPVQLETSRKRSLTSMRALPILALRLLTECIQRNLESVAAFASSECIVAHNLKRVGNLKSPLLPLKRDSDAIYHALKYMRQFVNDGCPEKVVPYEHGVSCHRSTMYCCLFFFSGIGTHRGFPSLFQLFLQ